MLRTILMSVMLILPVCVPAVSTVAGNEPATDDKAVEQSLVDNPVFLHWKNFKIGSTSKLVIETKAGDVERAIIVTQTLKEIKDDGVVVERLESVRVGSAIHRQPPQRVEIPSKATPKQAARHSDPEGKTDEGEEEVELNGNTIKCRWITATVEREGTTVTSKVWVSDSVPGMVVKMESKTDGRIATETTGEVESYEVVE